MNPTGEVRGRGTNRLIEMRGAAGIRPREFEEVAGAAVVRSSVDVLGLTRTTPQVAAQVVAILQASRQAVSAEALQRAAGLSDRVHFLRSYLRPLLARGWLERTIPDKPRSSRQHYRLTEAGRAVLWKEGPE
ncbi:MAG: Fic family protein [Acidobacteriota bacterium]